MSTEYVLVECLGLAGIVAVWDTSTSKRCVALYMLLLLLQLTKPDYTYSWTWPLSPTYQFSTTTQLPLAVYCGL